MARASIGRWGGFLAVRVPGEVERRMGLTDGEIVDVDTVDGTIVITRPDPSDRRDRALKAAEAIIRDSDRHSLGDIGIRALIDEGRRG